MNAAKRALYATLTAVLALLAMVAPAANADIPDEVWDYVYQYSSVVCAVIDGGVADGHPEDAVYGVWQGVQEDGFTSTEAAEVILLSVRTECPQNQAVMDEIMNS